MNTYSDIVLTDSLERKLLQAELSQQMNYPLDGVFSDAAKSVVRLAGKLGNMIHAVFHAAPKAA